MLSHGTVLNCVPSTVTRVAHVLRPFWLRPSFCLVLFRPRPQQPLWFLLLLLSFLLSVLLRLLVLRLSRPPFVPL